MYTVLEMKLICGTVHLLIPKKSNAMITTKLQSTVVCYISKNYTYIYTNFTYVGSNSSMMYGALRLTDGDNSSGRLQINFYGRWGSVCSRNFDTIDGHVACRQLGFKGVISVSNVTNAWFVSLRISAHTCMDTQL